MHFRRRGRYHRIDPADIITVPDNTIGLTILHLRSLFYNADSVNLWYSLRTLLHPLFDFVERHMAFFGPFFTVVVFFMLFFFVVIAYLIGVPYWQERSPFVLYIAAILGHWLLINVVFNYYKCLVTSPGYPSDRQLITEATSFCRKCLAPKPPRAHHCKICKSCILKMDHHCPWLNNCIGHYNHRYFFFFCFYTWIGTIYVFIFGIWIFIDHFFPHRSVFKQPMYHSYEIVQGYQKEFTTLDYIYDINGLFGISHANLRSRGILYEFWCCLLIFFLVGGLLIYHSILITRGETCIERHINGKNKELYRRFKRYFRAPYDFGRRENWRQFLGLRRNAHPLLSLILPSNFPPHGDGFHWEEVDQGMPGPDLHLRAPHHRAPYYRAPQAHHHHFQKCAAQPPMQYPI